MQHRNGNVCNRLQLADELQKQLIAQNFIHFASAMEIPDGWMPSQGSSVTSSQFDPDIWADLMDLNAGQHGFVDMAYVYRNISQDHAFDLVMDEEEVLSSPVWQTLHPNLVDKICMFVGVYAVPSYSLRKEQDRVYTQCRLGHAFLNGHMDHMMIESSVVEDCKEYTVDMPATLLDRSGKALERKEKQKMILHVSLSHPRNHQDIETFYEWIPSFTYNFHERSMITHHDGGEPQDTPHEVMMPHIRQMRIQDFILACRESHRDINSVLNYLNRGHAQAIILAPDITAPMIKMWSGIHDWVHHMSGRPGIPHRLAPPVYELVLGNGNFVKFNSKHWWNYMAQVRDVKYIIGTQGGTLLCKTWGNRYVKIAAKFFVQESCFEWEEQSMVMITDFYKDKVCRSKTYTREMLPRVPHGFVDVYPDKVFTPWHLQLNHKHTIPSLKKILDAM